MTVFVAVIGPAGLTVSEKNTETMLLRTPAHTTPASPLVGKAAGDSFKHTAFIFPLGGLLHDNVDITLEAD